MKHWLTMKSWARIVGVLLGAQALGLGCGVLHDSAKPAAYGMELNACVEESKTRAEYATCCTDVAMRYGRDPSFCSSKDGGQ